MIGPFCGIESTSNEEYRKIVRKKMRAALIGMAVGLLTILASFAVVEIFELPLDSHMQGFYSGVGTGILAASIVIWARYWIMLKDEEKLKRSRIDLSDERNKEISNAAFRVASLVLIIALYLAAFILGIWYPVVIKVLMGLVLVFAITYLVAYTVLSRKY